MGLRALVGKELRVMDGIGDPDHHEAREETQDDAHTADIRPFLEGRCLKLPLVPVFAPQSEIRTTWHHSTFAVASKAMLSALRLLASEGGVNSRPGEKALVDHSGDVPENVCLWTTPRPRRPLCHRLLSGKSRPAMGSQLPPLRVASPRSSSCLLNSPGSLRSSSGRSASTAATGVRGDSHLPYGVSLLAVRASPCSTFSTSFQR